MSFEHLPSLIAFTALVAVFWSILKRGVAERLELWLFGWAMVLVHFLSFFIGAAAGLPTAFDDAISIIPLEIAGLAFLVSVSAIATNIRRAAMLFTVILVPVLGYTVLAILDVQRQLPYYILIVGGTAAILAVVFRHYRRLTPFTAGTALCVVFTAGLLTWATAKNNPGLGVVIELAAINLVVAGLYWRRFRRTTAGVVLTVCGFAAWGLVFPAGYLTDTLWPNLHVESEVWNIPKYFVAVGMILTLLEDNIDLNYHLAHHDALTGLPNRRLLADRLDQALAGAQRTETKVAVMILDLDLFKQVNDTRGHRIGDLLLQGVVARMLQRIRSSDTLARTGGDEFTVISEISSRNGAETLAASLVSCLQKPIPIEGERLESGVSIGVAIYPDDAQTADELRGLADEAMYFAKRSGRSRYALASAGTKAAAFKNAEN